MSRDEFGGRSYVSGSYRPSMFSNSPMVHSGVDMHRQTADVAGIAVVDDDADDHYAEGIPIDGSGNHSGYLSENIPETEPLVSDKHTFGAINALLELGPRPTSVSMGSPGPSPAPALPHAGHYFIKPLQYLPAVFLGVLLNVLDGLSYGMIMFPVGDAIFSNMAPTGLSMFYISTVVSQLVYSLGGSAFAAGIGSEMIEVTPFFHSMALAISARMDSAPQNAVITTTIIAYAASSVVTGLVFFALGKLRLGALVGFFPRHILVGCIGGVGYFLVVTGLEVSSRITGGIRYDWSTACFLFANPASITRWLMPLTLAAVLVALQSRVRHALLVPLYFIAVFGIFHLIVWLVPNWSLSSARSAGFVFPAVENNEPWWAHYANLQLQAVDWVAIGAQFPTMLALTFFGILHVPINVPALAVTVGIDHFDVDRELVAHGLSNAILGLVGSVQNYLVYTNSVLFIRAGADDRLAGVLLAAATVAVMVAGPVVIGYIPVCVVGALIYLLGYELLKEALFDTWRRLRRIEYSTVVIIVLVMGAWDFVYGILVGVLLACLSFVVEAARRPVVKGVYTGVVARSTVLRHPKQQAFLKDVGNQICVVKLQGTVFFGSIGGVETAIRDKFHGDKFLSNPIKYLIVDMNGVDSIDFSAAEGFRRILNLTADFHSQLIISSVEDDDDIVSALRDAGLWDAAGSADIHLFLTLNYALEWCENSFLQTYARLRGSSAVPSGSPSFKRLLRSPRHSASPRRPSIAADLLFGTPRSSQVYKAATRTASDENRAHLRYYANNDAKFKKQPLPLIMITFEGLSSRDEKFWSTLAPFLIREQIPENLTFYDTAHDNPSFFIVELGMISSACKFESDRRELHSSILPNTAFGDLFLLSQYRSMLYTTVSDTVAWRLPENRIPDLLAAQDGQQVYCELLKVQTTLLKERFDSLTANLVLST